jgi:phosphatidylserine/phosphatidylglycerophosphate/cardiolipin synthase-like enzyme
MRSIPSTLRCSPSQIDESRLHCGTLPSVASKCGFIAIEGNTRTREQRGGSVRAIIAGEPNISIKVKNSKELMHEKVALYDGHLLRDGSSNWSISAARYQDNEISVSDNAAMAHAFASDFERMWSRPDNTGIQ